MAVTLYRNFTVVVQNATTYDPDNDLELFLYEGQLEIKIDPNTGDKAVFQYGTTTLAVQVVDQYGVAATALAADTTDRPGEYDFVGLDLDGTTAGDAGETLYSVVGRPAADTNFDRAMIIIENTDISDPNTKQLVKLSIGSTDSMASNVAFAGGTVTFVQYTADTTNAPNSASAQYLKLTNLPSGITNLIETPDAAPLYAVADPQMLVPRFNVYYGSGATRNTIVWQGLPAYLTSDGSWVIELKANEYNIIREKDGTLADFGTGGTDLDLSSIYTQFVVSVEVQRQNIHVRNFQQRPSTTLTGIATKSERICIHTYVSGTDRIVGIGDFDYSSASETPSYNLDVRGSLGARITVGTVNRFFVNASYMRVGYDDTSNYFGMLPALGVIVVGGYSKLLAASTYVRMGIDATSYPYFNATTDEVWVKGSANTYLEVLTSENIYGNVAVGSSSLRMLALSPTSQKIGYDIGGTVDNYFGSSLAQMAIVLNSVGKFVSTATSLFVGINTSTYPRISTTSSVIRIEASADEYAEYLLGSPNAFNVYTLYAAAKRLAFSAKSDDGGGTSITYIGYDSTSSYYAKFSATGIAFQYNLATRLIDATSASIAIGTSTTDVTNPSLYLTGSNSYLKGNANTYVRITSADQIYAYVNASGSKRMLSMDGTDSRFGYNVDSSGLYWKLSSTTANLMAGSSEIFRYDGTNVYLSPVSPASYPAILLTTAGSIIAFASATGVGFSASPTVVTLANGTCQHVLSSTKNELSYSATYVRVETEKITLNPTILSGYYASTQVEVGVHQSTISGTVYYCGYLKVPYNGLISVNAEPGCIQVIDDGVTCKLWVKTGTNTGAHNGWRHLTPVE